MHSYEDTSFLLLVNVTISSGIYTIECLMIAKQLKEVFDLLQENKKLTHTIKTILQTFPEGVIIVVDTKFEPLTKNDPLEK